MDEPEQESLQPLQPPLQPPLQEARQEDAKPRLPPAWPYGLLIFLATPVLIGAVGYFFPSAGCVFAAGVYLAELVGGLALRGGVNDRLGRSLLFSLVATCAAAGLGVLIAGGMCMTMGYSR